jgi:nucleoside-diphosphate-sugar epimerase
LSLRDYQSGRIRNHQPFCDVTYLQALSGKEIKRTALPPVEGDLPHTNADISKARQVLGYNPQVPFSKGIKLWWEWFRKQ